MRQNNCKELGKKSFEDMPERDETLKYVSLEKLVLPN